ncbi:MAG TPA: serine protease [Candidatus Anammoximicrobium sp.]|nr:serine protease [Candidatus Anammoximicrobium sp.]
MALLTAIGGAVVWLADWTRNRPSATPPAPATPNVGAARPAAEVGAVTDDVPGDATAARPGSAAGTRAERGVYERLLESTVWVLSPWGEDKTATGTGSLVDREHRLVVTNAHVVADRTGPVVVFFPTYKDGELAVQPDFYFQHATRYAGQVVHSDVGCDLALVRLESLPERAQAVPLAEESVRPSDPVHSVGNPGESGALWVYTPGTVRQVYDAKYDTNGGHHIEARVVETASPINPGDSGGPVVNAKGELVAVNQSHAASAQLITHCIDISEVRRFLEEYRSR